MICLRTVCSFLVVAFLTAACSQAPASNGYPSDEERKAAIEALEKGGVDPAIKYFLKIRDYYIAAAGDPFSKERYISERKKRGEESPEYFMNEVEKIHEEIRQGLLEKAAEASFHAGALATVRSDEEAERYYAEAVKLYPIEKYAKALRMVREMRKFRQKKSSI